MGLYIPLGFALNRTVDHWGRAASMGLSTFTELPTTDTTLVSCGTPKAIITRLNTEINAALKLPDVRTKLEAAGIEIQGGTPAEYAALIKSDLAKWGKVVKEANIPAE